MEQLQQTFKFKNDAIEPPTVYLGTKLEKKKTGNGTTVWSQSSQEYIKEAIKNVEERLAKQKKFLSTRADTPTHNNIVFETDDSPELNAEDTQWYQELMGILRWATECGRVDILTEISLLSAYQASPRQTHLDEALHIFAYLKKKPKLSLYFDPTLPNIDPTIFNDIDATEFAEYYRDAKEEIPSRMPQPRGQPITMTAYVDASHAANKKTRRSHTGYLIFVNRAPIIWYSKRQSTVESSTFGSEFIAMKTCVEHIMALRYKLRMFGVPILDETRVFCDNQSVVNNSSRVDSVLNRKHNSIAYHLVRHATAARIIKVGKIDGKINPSDAMTKRLDARRRDELYSTWTY